MLLFVLMTDTIRFFPEDLCVIIMVWQSHLSGGDGAMLPVIQSQQFYAAKGSLHE